MGSSLSSAFGQATSPASSATQSEPPPVELSPFTVTGTKDEGYLAASTLAGSRLNTSLYDTPAAISVMTSEFLEDVGAVTVEKALEYAVNAEPDRTDGTGNVSSSSDLPLSIRGLSGATLARNYFIWGLESDSYNTERLDFSRGPNSILFGTGGPGGIINTTTKRAVFGRDVQQVGVRVGSWDDYRGTVDVGRQLSDKLAVRVNGVVHSQRSWREFVSSDRNGAALAATYRPFRATEIRFDGEMGVYDRVLSNPFLPGDAVTPWIAAGRPISTTYGTVVNGTARGTSRVWIHDPIAGTVQSWFGSVNTSAPAQAQSAGIPRALTDFSVLPLKANLSGEGNRTDSHYDSLALFIEQRIGPVWFELAANRQTSSRTWVSSSAWNNIVLRADANAVLPNGQPNPNVGKYYFDAIAQQNTNASESNNYRATAAYTLDLRDRNPWFGAYSITGLYSLRESWLDTNVLMEVNTTPTGDATYPRDLTSANNRIWRRIYVDPFGPGRRGGIDARQAMINQNGVVSGYRRINNNSREDGEDLSTLMIAGQAKLLRDRLVVTGGIRDDEQENSFGSAIQDPVTREWSKQIYNRTSNSYEGRTTTFGAVFHVTSWLSATYNRSDNFVPQTGFSPFDDQIGPRRGEGEDYGFKLRLLDGRVYASALRYDTSEVNRIVFLDGGLVGAINEIHESIGDTARISNNRDSIDTDGTGYEFEITANLTPQWRLTANYSRAEATQSNNQPRIQSYVAARRAAWQQRGSTALIPPVSGVPANDPSTGAPATVQTALNSIDNYFRSILGANGVTRRQHREQTGSLFTAYTLRSDQKLLHNLTAGLGVRFRGKPVVGYINGVDPIFGKNETLVNAMLRKRVAWGRRSVQLQANFDNILNVNDPIAVDADLNGGYRFLYPNPFRWSLSATYNF